MTTQWEPYREPLRITVMRTGLIALVVGAVVAWRWGGMARWPVAVVMVLWVSFGGHWVEVWFLNWLRPRISGGRGVQVLARVAVWFVGGVVLGMGVRWTAVALGMGIGMGAWWMGGVAFIGVELVAHLAIWGRGGGCFYNGRG